MTQYLTDSQYEQEAKKYLNYFKMKLSFDNIGTLIHWLMKADFRYKEGIGNFSRENFRYFYAKCACKTIVKEEKRIKYKLLDNKSLCNISKKEVFNATELIRDSNYLTSFEKEVLVQHYLNKNKMKDIAEKTGKSRQYVSQVKKKALKKLKENES